MSTQPLRERVLDAALAVLEEEGPTALSQGRVAKQAGIQQGHLTYYFPKKADLVAGVLERFTDDDEAAFIRLAEEVSGQERAEVEQVAVRYVKQLIRDQRRTRVLVSLLVHGFQDPEVLSTLAERGLRQRALMAAFLGRPEEDEDVELAYATLRGLALQQVLHRYDDKQVDRLVTRFRAWLAALPPQKTTKKRRSTR